MGNLKNGNPQEGQLESHRRMVEYLESRLTVESALAQGLQTLWKPYLSRSHA